VHGACWPACSARSRLASGPRSRCRRAGHPGRYRPRHGRSGAHVRAGPHALPQARWGSAPPGCHEAAGRAPAPAPPHAPPHAANLCLLRPRHQHGLQERGRLQLRGAHRAGGGWGDFGWEGWQGAEGKKRAARLCPRIPFLPPSSPLTPLPPRQYLTPEEEAAADTPTEVAKGLPPAWPEGGAIAVQELCLRYRPGMPLVLRGVSFSVAAGENVGLVGRTGSGKSSLLLALFRMVSGRRGGGRRREGGSGTGRGGGVLASWPRAPRSPARLARACSGGARERPHPHRRSGHEHAGPAAAAQVRGRDVGAHARALGKAAEDASRGRHEQAPADARLTAPS
jgi:hypothetical protein